MGTRSLHKFYGSEELLEEQKPTAVIYRHWDGYIEGAGLDIKEFLETLRDTNMDSRFNDSSYLSAKYLVYLAQNFAGDWADNPLDFLSVGIMPTHKDVDAWQEYTYHFICEVQDNGLPKVLVDDYEGDRIDLFEAIKKI
mgnify:CR=1 FL=1